MVRGPKLQISMEEQHMWPLVLLAVIGASEASPLLV